MKYIALLCMLVGVTRAADYTLSDNNLEPSIRKGPWISLPDNFDNREEITQCGVDRHTLVACDSEIGDKDIAANRYSDGNWMRLNRQTNRMECYSYTNKETEGYIRARAVCQQLIVYPFNPDSPSPRLGPNPSVKCPPNYKMFGCWFHSDKMDTEHWQNGAKLVKDFATNTCSVTGCALCRVQASCLRIQIETPPSLDVLA